MKYCLGVLALVVLAACDAVVPEGGEKVSGQGLANAVSGKTIAFSFEGRNRVEITTFNPNGTGTSGSKGRFRDIRWNVRGDQLCINFADRTLDEGDCGRVLWVSDENLLIKRTSPNGESFQVAGAFQ